MALYPSWQVELETKTMRDDESTKPRGMMKAQNHVHNSQITLNTKP
jgi:hypothetical protein